MELKYKIGMILLLAVLIMQLIPNASAIPVLTITQPTREYFIDALPYYNLPINFTVQNDTAGSCWYDLKKYRIIQDPANETSLNARWTDGSNTYDSNWATYGLADPSGFDAIVWENFSVPNGYNASTFTVKMGVSEDVGKEPSISIWNYTSNAWETFKTYTAVAGGTTTTEELTLPSTSVNNLNNNMIQIKTTVKRGTGIPYGTVYFEGNITFISNSSTILINCQNSTFNMSNSGNHIFYLFMNDTSGLENSSSSNFNINLYNTSHWASQGNVTEGDDITFTLQINSTNITEVNATFYYNNTAYNYGTRENRTNQANFTKAFNILAINGTIPYYWNYTINSLNNLTNKKNISVTRIDITNCTSGINSITFWMKDETNLTNIVIDLSTAITYWTNSSLINRTLNMTMSGRSNYSLCIHPNYTTYTSNVNVEYSSTIYAKRYYYLINATMNNVTQNIDLYSLLLSQATLTSLEVYDQYTDAIKEVIIHIQRYDITTDSYYVIGMAKTSHEGKDIAYLDWYNTVYKFLLFKNNALLQISNPQKIGTTPITFIVMTIQQFPYDEFDNMQYSLTFNNDTGNFILTFADSSGQVSAGCLRVINRTSEKDEILYDSCVSSASGTLYYHIDNNVTASYLATFYAKGSPPKIIDSISKTIRGIQKIIYDYIGNLDGTVLAIIFAGTASFAGLFNPVLSVIFIIAGLFGAMSLGFTLIEWSVFWGVAIIGGIIIWKLKT